MTEDLRLELERVVLTEAAEIIAAREKCLILHATSDIDAAGDEVEICVRNLLRRRLGQNYYVGHGHIVDMDWTVSPQFDVIVADASVVPAIFRSENGTEYFPYEAVHAVGETKAIYRKAKNQIEAFMKARQKISTLNRADVPANYIRGYSGGFYFGSGFVSSDRKGAQNNLFTFMLFAGSGDFSVADGAKLYSSNAADKFPNIVCLLDRGLIVYTQFDKFSPSDGKYENLSFLSQPSRPAIDKDRVFAWTLYSNGNNEPRALSWGALYGILADHLMNNTLKPESPIRYLQRLASTPVHQFLSEPNSREDR
jgi:hypothetical protein